MGTWNLSRSRKSTTSEIPYYRTASASTIKTSLRYDSFGLGAGRGANHDGRRTTCLDNFQDLFGRLNGKKEQEMDKKQKMRLNTEARCSLSKYGEEHGSSVKAFWWATNCMIYRGNILASIPWLSDSSKLQRKRLRMVQRLIRRHRSRYKRSGNVRMREWSKLRALSAVRLCFNRAERKFRPSNRLRKVIARRKALKTQTDEY